MKKFLMASVAFAALAISANGQTYKVCGASEMIELAKQNDPGYAQRLADLETFTQQYIQANSQQRTSGTVVYTIPVVVHVIHNYGDENISKAQILDAIETMNKSFQKLYGDSVLVCSIFRPINADTQIEFRLAQLDPNGNCTDGITRTVSPLTFDADDNVKQLVSWPSDMYFNIWVVDNISFGAAGYAYYPGAPSGIDGVVILNNYFGSIGTGTGSNYAARAMTHEAGHWLNLAHTWGSTNNPGVPSNCNASDNVPDTPPTMGTNDFTCDTTQSTCGFIDNVQNYMDYAACHYMFTEGQKQRMHAALNSSTGDRNNLWTPSNLMATGTDGSPVVLCVPVAAFSAYTRTICEGASLNFPDGSYNAAISSWSWDFPGGTPSTSNMQNPVIQYNNAGVYDVTLTVTNAAGTTTVTNTGVVKVLPATGQYTIPYTESFENITFPGTEWEEVSEGGNMWEQNTFAAKTGVNSIYLRNYSGNPPGTKDIFYTPSYNLTGVSAPSLTFQMASAMKSASSADNLKIYVSTTCGQLWSARYNRAGASLSTAGVITQNFYPTPAQWRQESVHIASVAFSNKPNVRFKFEYTLDNGNNIFIDDININGTVGINEVFEESLMFSIYPNPAPTSASIEFILPDRMDVRIEVIDMLGKIVNQVTPGILDAGEYQFELPVQLAPGLYNVRLTAGGYPVTRKVVIY